MHGVLVAETTELAKLHTIRMCALVFVRRIVASLALFAGEYYQLAWHDLKFSRSIPK